MRSTRFKVRNCLLAQLELIMDLLVWLIYLVILLSLVTNSRTVMGILGDLHNPSITSLATEVMLKYYSWERRVFLWHSSTHYLTCTILHSRHMTDIRATLKDPKIQEWWFLSQLHLLVKFVTTTSLSYWWWLTEDTSK
jgi:hypothetical protein